MAVAKSRDPSNPRLHQRPTNTSQRWPETVSPGQGAVRDQNDHISNALLWITNRLSQVTGGDGKHTWWLAPAVLGAIFVYLAFITVPLEMLPQNSYYNLLTDAFLTGTLALPVDPSPELLALKDPYDPGANGPFRLHDVALYNGKYYLYHGLTPALLLFGPAKLFFGVTINQSMAVWLFVSTGLIAATWCLFILLRIGTTDRPTWLMLAGIVALGLSNAGPFMLVRPDVYEVAISCGYFLNMTFLALALLASLSPGTPRGGRLVAFAGLCLGLAVGARPNSIVLAPLLTAVAWAHVHSLGHRTLSRGFIACLLPLFVPFGICILTIMLYNYLRFDDCLQFGPRYLLMANHPRAQAFFRFDTLVERLGRYLLAPPGLEAQFPFVYLPHGNHFGEPDVGAVWMAPIIILVGCWGAAVAFHRKAAFFSLGAAQLLLILGGGILMLVFLPVVANPLIRYIYDFLGLLLLSSFFVWSQVRTRLMPQPGLRIAFDALCLLLVAWGCWVGIAFGTNHTPPSAIRHFYSARTLLGQGRQPEALEELSVALVGAPDFYLARSLRARLLASQTGGNPAEAAAEFSRAMRDFTSQAAAAQNRGYMPAFQGLVIADPVAEYSLVAQPLLQRGEPAAALAALRGMAEAFVAAGFGRQALGILQAVKAVAERSNLPDFARMVGEMIGPAASQSAPPPGP